MKPRGDPEFRIYWKMLPHWRRRGSTYFVTWRLRRGCGEIDEHERDVVQDVLMRGDGRNYRLHAYVVMNDHVHALLTPSDEIALDRILRAWKSISSRRIQKGRVSTLGLWQDEYFDRIVRDDAEFLEKAQYILNNPWKRWPELEEYPWVGLEGADERRGGSEDPPPPGE